MSVSCRFCCKSRKLHRSEFLVNSSNATRPTIRITSVALPRSPLNLACGDEVPQIREKRACGSWNFDNFSKPTFAKESARSRSRLCPGMPALIPSSAGGDGGRVVRLVPGSASLRPSQVLAQDSAEHPLPKQGRQAWEAEEELEEELEGVLFATPGRPAREDLDVGCWKSSTVGCWKSSAAASPDSVGS
jgi:hypothetical protein